MSSFSQKDFVIDNKLGLKVLAGMNMVIHCHHYNARLQRTLEQNHKINGKEIFRNAATITYWELLKELDAVKRPSDKAQFIENLYKFLGFGTLNLSSLEEDRATSSSGHFVEGWNCGALKTKGTVCTMTEGFLEGAIKAMYNLDVEVRETCCANQPGVERCEFQITRNKSGLNFHLAKKNKVCSPARDNSTEALSNIKAETIIDAVMNMPLSGNNEGLIPAFNVYLAHTPQDFYNRVALNFIAEMNKVGFGSIAKEMLVEDAEHCALNTFGGVLESEEWSALVLPMVKEEKDNLFGLVAVANALGWGRCHITEHTPYKTLTLHSSNGYEAYGHIETKGYSDKPQCFMLRGVCAGLMGLVYENGELEDRSGKFLSRESSCLAARAHQCEFKVERDE